jgi:hypothetical protein
MGAKDMFINQNLQRGKWKYEDNIFLFVLLEHGPATENLPL